MAEHFLIVMKGALEPEITGPIRNTRIAVAEALLDELRRNLELLNPDGEDNHFVLTVSFRKGKARLSTTLHSRAYMDELRARVFEERGDPERQGGHDHDAKITLSQEGSR